MEGDKSTDNGDDYYKNVKLVGFVKTDSETLPGYKNDAFQWSSEDNLPSYPSSYNRVNDISASSKYYCTALRKNYYCPFNTAHTLVFNQQFSPKFFLLELFKIRFLKFLNIFLKDHIFEYLMRLLYFLRSVLRCNKLKFFK